MRKIQTKPTKNAKIYQKGRGALGKVRAKAGRRPPGVVDYATTNPGDSHRPGRTTEITND